MTDLADVLMNPAIYPWAPDSVQRVDTHLSHVYLAGERVLKIKRPVNYGFVDFRSLDARRQSCEDELRLNRRLTTGVYLDAVPITVDGGVVQIDGTGDVVEWGTVMRRLPVEGMLDARIRRGDVPADLGLQLGQHLVMFHRSVADPCDQFRGSDGDSSITVVLENLDELAPFSGPILDDVQYGMVAVSLRSYIAENRDFLDRRVADGWIRQGHGDLRAEHICIEPDGTIQVFDCVEFSKKIRCADVASDLAFLLMDLNRLARPDLAADVVRSYRDGGIELPGELIRLYTAHRALVRAKVACLSMGGVSGDSATMYPTEASEYLNLATAAALRAEPVLIAMTGLSGTGKSTVARAIGQALGVPVLTSDEFRKQLAGVEGSAASAWQEGIYSPDWTARTYGRLLDGAEADLRGGRAVVIDATFLDERWRSEVASRASDVGAPVLFVEVTSDPEVVERRLRARATGGTSNSDASIETFREQARVLAANQIHFPDGAYVVNVDTSSDGPVRIGRVLRELEEIGALGLEITPERH